MNNRFVLSAAGVSVAAISGAAVADVSVSIPAQALTGGQGHAVDLGPVSGTVTAILYTYVWENSTGDSSWASDMMFGLSVNDSFGLSMGGYNMSMSSISGVTNSSWTYLGGISGSPSDGSYSGFFGSLSFTMSGTGTAWLANGWNGSAGTFTSAELTFVGLNAVPAPGALALLGLAGVAGVQRRRK